MKKILILIFISLLSSKGLIFSQQKIWSLEDCIKYAIDNNLQIKQQDIQTKFQKNTLELSKYKLLPTVNGSASHNYTFGRALDQTTYQYTNHQQVQSNNFYVGGSLNLFSGLQNYNTIKKNEFLVLAGEQDLQNIKDNIALTIALDYLQILLNKELVLATDNQLQITKQQIEKTRKLVDAGSVAKGNLLQIEAQASQEEVQYITVKNQLDISYLNISQMLELKTPEGFEIVTPQIAVDTNGVVTGNIDEIFAAAQNIRPEIKSSELNLTASEYDMKIATGGRYPRLSMSHSFSTGYSDIRKKPIGIDASGPIYGKYPFSEQVNDNISYGIGFTLNIPILNGWMVNKNIVNSKLTVESNKYALEGVKKQLYKNIQQAYTDALASLKKYNASTKAVSSSQESFRYIEQKLKEGMVTSVDYNAEKTKLLKAQSDMAQAKYEYVFKTKVLDFYKGLPLNLSK